MTDMVDVRCPVTPRRLFMRLRIGDAHIVPGNLIEVACDDCRKAERRLGHDCSLVLHRFNLLGDHVSSERFP